MHTTVFYIVFAILILYVCRIFRRGCTEKQTSVTFNQWLIAVVGFKAILFALGTFYA